MLSFIVVMSTLHIHCTYRKGTIRNMICMQLKPPKKGGYVP